MKERITKGCTFFGNYRRDYRCYVRARDGFGALLDMLGVSKNDIILMPGYIGWSAREGSGVFDPIVERKLKPIFYHLDDKLKICQPDITVKMAATEAKVLLLIHFFGFPDPDAAKYAELARERGIIVIEDSAHAMYTDLIEGGCGDFGDYSLFSLHKMLPVASGGLICARSGVEIPASNYQLDFDPFAFDLVRISEVRRDNYLALDTVIKGTSSLIVPLYDELPANVIPQTYPIILPYSNRDKIYEYMNDKGWGVVSLYHTMIHPISVGDYPDEKRLAHTIMNLPVHQDVDRSLYHEMIDDLLIAAADFKLENS
jgi:dTDP-4-amino-4,6-dideoxygalactose transaminase